MFHSILRKPESTFSAIFTSMTPMKAAAAILLSAVLFVGSAPAHAADKLPARLDDATFWNMVSMFSEPDGHFRYENLLSNETSYQMVIPSLIKVAPPDGVYIGVGPEQNFTYIAALRPNVAFIVDIRRQNMLEHLMYKAVFEFSENRADFVSQLFSRKPMSAMGDSATAQELFKSYESRECDRVLLMQTLQRVFDRLGRSHGFPLTVEDKGTIEHILETFCLAGPQIDYGFVNAPSNVTAPSYVDLMTATDARGQNWSYLATEEKFNRVREMQLRNLIVPLTGDFAGPKTLRAIGTYLKHYKATVAAFYVSNVEQYLDKKSTAFHDNVAALPSMPASTLVRFTPPESTQLEPIRIFLAKKGSLFHLLNGKE
jgi:hypothetical protein